ncbi:lipocalin family protein [Methyloceanibacter stevinii]|nr:lipocalin family protein [Methyloceanibacter stevinii]
MRTPIVALALGATLILTGCNEDSEGLLLGEWYCSSSMGEGGKANERILYQEGGRRQSLMEMIMPVGDNTFEVRSRTEGRWSLDGAALTEVSDRVQVVNFVVDGRELNPDDPLVQSLVNGGIEGLGTTFTIEQLDNKVLVMSGSRGGCIRQ